MPFVLSEQNQHLRYVDTVLSAFSYDDPIIREAIGLMKYQGVWDVARPLGGLLAEYTARYISLVDVVCIAVPLHRSRQVERGFNQAQLIARQFPCVFSDQAIIRCRPRPPQASLDAASRAANVMDVYQVRQPDVLYGKDILIVDDVITTGSTVDEIARIAKTAGARTVWAAAVARG
jgi:ComF family protein